MSTKCSIEYVNDKDGDEFHIYHDLMDGFGKMNTQEQPVHIDISNVLEVRLNNNFLSFSIPTRLAKKMGVIKNNGK